MSTHPTSELLEHAAQHLESHEIDALRERELFDRSVLSVRIELRTLISVGVGFVGTGIALLIEWHVKDLRLLLTFVPLVCGVLFTVYSTRLHSSLGRASEKERPLRATLSLALGLVLLTGSAAAFQTFYAWPNVTNLGAAALFVIIAFVCGSRVALGFAASLLGAYIGVENVPINWKLFEITMVESASWRYVGILVAAAAVCRWGLARPTFAVTLFDFAVPVALVTQNVALFEAVDSESLVSGFIHFGLNMILALAATYIAQRAHALRMAFQAIVSLLVAAMTVVVLLVDLAEIEGRMRLLAFTGALLPASIFAMRWAVNLTRGARQVKQNE